MAGLPCETVMPKGDILSVCVSRHPSLSPVSPRKTAVCQVVMLHGPAVHPPAHQPLIYKSEVRQGVTAKACLSPTVGNRQLSKCSREEKRIREGNCSLHLRYHVMFSWNNFSFSVSWTYLLHSFVVCFIPNFPLVGGSSHSLKVCLMWLTSASGEFTIPGLS